LEDQHGNHQASVVEVEGNISKQYVFILIDPGSSHDYVELKVVDSHTLKKRKQKKSWLVSWLYELRGK
jgi:hypothetical protein